MPRMMGAASGTRVAIDVLSVMELVEEPTLANRTAPGARSV